MATKTISIDIEAYRRLVQARQKNEWFSQVIKRKVRRPLDVNAWVKKMADSPMDEAAGKAVEEQVAGRRRRSRRRM